MVYLPHHRSDLNPIEHYWGRAKSYARYLVGEHFLDASWTKDVMEAALNRITHGDILADMQHDGYGVKESTRVSVKLFSKRSIPVAEDLVCFKNPNLFFTLFSDPVPYAHLVVLTNKVVPPLFQFSHIRV